MNRTQFICLAAIIVLTSSDLPPTAADPKYLHIIYGLIVSIPLLWGIWASPKTSTPSEDR